MKNLVKTPAEIEVMRAGGRILAAVLRQVAAAVKPGVSTAELDKIASRELLARGAKPSFLGYRNEQGQAYPASLCTSINHVVVHGMPSAELVLKEGDVLGLDLGCWYKGLCTDTAITVPVGAVSSQARKLIKAAEQALHEGLKQVRGAARLGDIGHAIQTFVAAQGFAVVRALTGHGVGRAVHEEPSIPNFGRAGAGSKLVTGMTLAIEPMVNAGGYEVETLTDNWTVITADGSLSAHFEHTVVVTDNGYEILTKV